MLLIGSGFRLFQIHQLSESQGKSALGQISKNIKINLKIFVGFNVIYFLIFLFYF